MNTQSVRDFFFWGGGYLNVIIISELTKIVGEMKTTQTEKQEEEKDKKEWGKG